ncbi:hypothetical protein PTTG_01905 [Puccinia triticina 1-1 BBBD Race 1]|uniref:Uncharacterized protein n=2 Tax=Puccinia triticina TaxID=208348 RepID=A0A0C4EMB5_PUCT1|nr:uncharacterized protein PtA15_1A605 [Puccinia triticina]OAV97589.1 hypothetical protein PTTG_01905 [Puccinia triticina 1-1 BBBD Race 1]WAQ81265.1 hypothetical protein PtA15_1A605 [Puccinia triticina]WAR52155.1 hypothetical protein PtB15_1B594 [Puccinia triticina]
MDGWPGVVSATVAGKGHVFNPAPSPACHSGWGLEQGPALSVERPKECNLASIESENGRPSTRPQEPTQPYNIGKTNAARSAGMANPQSTSFTILSGSESSKSSERYLNASPEGDPPTTPDPVDPGLRDAQPAAGSHPRARRRQIRRHISDTSAFESFLEKRAGGEKHESKNLLKTFITGIQPDSSSSAAPAVSAPSAKVVTPVPKQTTTPQ